MKFCCFCCWEQILSPSFHRVAGTVLSNPLDSSFSDLGSFSHMHALLCTQLIHKGESSSVLQICDFVQLSTLDYLGFLGLLATPPSTRETIEICLCSVPCTLAWRLSPSSKLEQSGAHFLFLSSKIIAFWCMISNILGDIVSCNLFIFFFFFKVSGGGKCGLCYLILISS